MKARFPAFGAETWDTNSNKKGVFCRMAIQRIPCDDKESINGVPISKQS